MWGAALISAVLGTRLPGPGTVYASQTLKFHAPIRVGDTLTITVTVTARDEANHRLVLDCTLHQPGGPDGDRRAGDRDCAHGAHRARARHAAASANRACARRRSRAAAAVRAAAREARDGRRSSLRQREPVRGARCSRRRPDRAGAHRTARAYFGGRGEVGVEDRRPRDRGRAAQPRGRRARRRARAQAARSTR